MNELKKINIFVAAWGESYIELAISKLLPSLSQPNNLPYLLGRYEVTIYFYGVKSDFPLICKCIGELGIAAHLTDISEIEDFSLNQHKYNKMTICHKDFLKRISDNSYAIFLHPDFFISDGMFVAMCNEFFESNHLCYYTHIFRTSDERASELDHMLSSNGFVNSFDLTKYCMLNQLPMTKNYDINNIQSSSWPIEIQIRENSNIYIFSYGLHPLGYKKLGQVDFQCFDGDMFDKALQVFGCQTMFANSNNLKFCIAELNRKTLRIGEVINRPQNPAYCAGIFDQYLKDKVRNRFFEHLIVYATNEENLGSPAPFQLYFFKMRIKFFLFLSSLKLFPSKWIVSRAIGNTAPYLIYE